MDILNGTIIEVDCPHCKYTNSIWIIVKIGRHGQQIIVCDGCGEVFTISYRTDVTVYGVEPAEV